jgi:hypothetical protein
MVYKFDPMYWNGTIFSLDETWEMGSGGWSMRVRINLFRPRISRNL